ncbi:MAG TPA: A24 family peptidase [Candidatus Nanoarchaeia archaeon]|nr:A24 family peptidase [Candidatus Nanoarchaeia archaeon]
MLVDYILIPIALIWLTFASISDLKSKEIPDWLNFSLIIIALAIKSIEAILARNVFILLYAIAALVIFFLLANLMYYTKQWGGGDAKLIIGLGIIFTQYPTEFLNYFNPKLTIPFAITFVVNILFIGAVYGIIWSVSLAIKNYKKIKFNKDIFKRPMRIILPLVLLFFLSSFLLPQIKYLFGVATIFFLVVYLILIFTNAVEQSIMIKPMALSKLREGDWLYKPVYYKKRLILDNKKPSLTKKDISALKRFNIKSVIVKDGIPFVPAFLISVLVSLIFGNFWLII